MDAKRRTGQPRTDDQQTAKIPLLFVCHGDDGGSRMHQIGRAHV